MVSRAVRLCGTESVDAPMQRLRAGALSAEFDNGALRYIRIGSTEVIRAIAFLVRDENWGTFTPAIEDLKIDQAADRFSVTYRATCADSARTLVYEARIQGEADGTLSFEVVAEPKTDVQTNRTGFIVLHPLEGVDGGTQDEALLLHHAPDRLVHLVRDGGVLLRKVQQWDVHLEYPDLEK